MRGAGVRGRCAFDRLPYFDSIKDALLDMMHAIAVTMGGHAMRVLRGTAWSTSAYKKTRAVRPPADPRVRYKWGNDLKGAPTKAVTSKRTESAKATAMAKMVAHREESVAAWEKACDEAEKLNEDMVHLVFPQGAQGESDALFRNFQV
jgi:hypothetical protein